MHIYVYTCMHICLNMYIYMYKFMAISLAVLEHPQMCCHSFHQRVSWCPLHLNWVNLWLMCNQTIMAEMMLRDFRGQVRKRYAASALFTRILPRKPCASMYEVQLPWGFQMIPAPRSGHPQLRPQTPGSRVILCPLTLAWISDPQDMQTEKVIVLCN